MDTTKIKYDNVVSGAAKAYLAKQYQIALKCYNEALELAKQMKMGKMMICILKYMIASCLVESETLNDLAEAVMILQTIDLSTKKRFPAIFCIMARAHCKLFRFKEGYQAITQGEESYRSICKTLLEVYYIPGTNIVIDQDIESESWMKVKEECKTYQQPDAICYYKDCCNITMPYTSPSKSIYFRDPAFDGMIVLKCNNTKHSCTLNYHKHCWKVQKDQLYPAEKVSDKDFLGQRCLNENCHNGKKPSTISYIEIIAANGTSKVHINVPDTETVEKLKVKESENAKVPDYQDLAQNYEDSIVIWIEDSNGVNFSHEFPEIAQKKEFLISMFEDYMRKNLVRVCDIYSKYAEYSEYLQLPDLDILNFLLAIGKVKILDGFTELPSYLDENIFEEDKEDYFDRLMSDVEDCGETQIKEKNKDKEIKVDKNSPRKYANIKAGGDAPPLSREIIDEPKNDASSVKSKKFTLQNNEPDEKEIENKKLKDNITQLESDLKKVKIENENLNKEIISKDADLDLLQKQLEDNNSKWKSLEEKICSFKQSHQDTKNENVRLKTEIIELMKLKEEAEQKLLEYNNPQARRKELLKSFEEEYKIIEEKLNSEWKIKSENMIKEALDEERKMRLPLLVKCLNNQYSNIRNTINRHIQTCCLTLDIIGIINGWISRTKQINKILENNNWTITMVCLNKALADAQEEYKTLSDKLQDKECTEKFEMLDINMTTPELPQLPKETAGDYVLKTLNDINEHMQSLFQRFQEPPTYIGPPVYSHQTHFATNYPQILPPPGMQPAPFPSSGLPSAPAAPGFNAFPHFNASMAAQYKQMQDHLQQEMQQQMQEIQQEVQQMRKKLELNSQVSYPDSVSSSNKSLNNVADDTLVQITPIEPELQEQTKILSQEENNFTCPNNNNNNNDVKIIYDTGSTTGNVCENFDSEKSLEINKHESVSFKTSAEDMQISKTDLEESAPLKKPIDNHDDDSDSRDERSVLFRQPLNDSQYNGKDQEQTENSKNRSERQSAPTPRKSINRLQHWEEGEEEKLLPSRSLKRPDDLMNWEEDLQLLKGNEDIKTNGITQYQDEDNYERQLSDIFDSKKPIKKMAKNTASQDDYGENLVMKYLMQDSNERRQRRPNFDDLVNRLKAKYPGTLESDIIYIISEIRKKHNNTLRGLTVRQILEEADEHFTNNQHIHLIRYFPNGKSEIPAKPSGIQHARNDSIGSASSYHTAAKSTSSARSLTSSKKTWNPILPQQEIKWTPSQEVDCSICTNKVTKNTCYTLNCGHSYHKTCAKSWFKTQRTCPNCRTPVTEEDEFPPLPH